MQIERRGRVESKVDANDLLGQRKLPCHRDWKLKMFNKVMNKKCKLQNDSVWVIHGMFSSNDPLQWLNINDT